MKTIDPFKPLVEPSTTLDLINANLEEGECYQPGSEFELGGMVFVVKAVDDCGYATEIRMREIQG